MIDKIKQGALNASSESVSGGFNGYLALLLMLPPFGYGLWALSNLIRAGEVALAFDAIGLIIAALALALLSAGFYMMQPNQGVASRCSALTKVLTAMKGCAGSGRGSGRLR